MKRLLPTSVLLVLCSTSALSATDSQSDSPPTPQPLPAAKTQIMLHAKVLSLDPQKLQQARLDLEQLLEHEPVKGRAYASPAAAKRAETVVSRRVGELIAQLLTASGAAKVLSEPTLMTLDGQPALFHVGGELPILVPQSLGTMSIEYRKLGTVVNITPKLLADDGRIRLTLTFAHSEVDKKQSVQVDGLNVPGLRSRQLTAAFELKPKQTAILRGPEASNALLIITPEIVPQPPRVIKPPTPREKPAPPLPLQAVLAELFPDAQIDIVPLSSSVVLRGTIDPRHVATVVQIAEDYYPRVINHLQAQEPAKSAAGQPPADAPLGQSRAGSAGSIDQEIRALREDVRVLRQDVRQLIELLEKQASVGSDSPSKTVADRSVPPDDVDPLSDDVIWRWIGLRLRPGKAELDRYRGGLEVRAVRPDSPAAQQDVRPGDVLVGLGKWEIVQRKDLDYVLRSAGLESEAELKIYLVRGREAMYGRLKLAPPPQPTDLDAADSPLHQQKRRLLFSVSLGLAQAGRRRDSIDEASFSQTTFISVHWRPLAVPTVRENRSAA